MNDYEIKVGKIDYYTWKAGAIILLLLLIIVLGTRNGVFGTTRYQEEVKDSYWHMGYAQCQSYYNFTVDEMLVLTQYKIDKLEREYWYNNGSGRSYDLGGQT